jgi:hypothetical protein
MKLIELGEKQGYISVFISLCFTLPLVPLITIIKEIAPQNLYLISFGVILLLIPTIFVYVSPWIVNKTIPSKVDV